MQGIYIVLQDGRSDKKPAWFTTLDAALLWNVRGKHHPIIDSFVTRVSDDHWILEYEDGVFNIHYMGFLKVR